MNVMNTLRISPLSPCVSWGDVMVFIMIWAAILFGVWKKAGQCASQSKTSTASRGKRK